MGAELYLGLMSGTSMNGVDAALCEFNEGRLQRILGAHTLPYPQKLRQRLLTIVQQQPALPLDELTALDAEVAQVFAQAANEVLGKYTGDREKIRAIGSHGQTLFHAPDRTPGTTLQIGDPNRIAALTGIATVADFRRRDLALGGQGAPLVPAFHHAQFSDAAEARVVINIGGIANITILPDGEAGVRGFDTGPGNGLMDEWAQEKLKQPHDDDGRWAASAEAEPALLQALLADAYFSRSPPKSTGRTEFGLKRCRQIFPGLDALDAARVQRSFCELTAHTIADAIRQHAPLARRVLVCGGGARNVFLLSRLQAQLRPIITEPTDALGLDAQWVEAAAFAWLAMRTMNGLPGNLPAVTGAKKSAILGGIYSTGATRL